MNNALVFLAEQAKKAEHQAQLALIAARQELANYQLQVQQIEQYRLDYCKKMVQLGQEGLTASRYGHLHRFIVQLDDTLTTQRQIAADFEQNVAHCVQHWQDCREKTQSFTWLIEKRQRQAQQLAEKKEQKQVDELAQLSYLRHRRHKNR